MYMLSEREDHLSAEIRRIVIVCRDAINAIYPTADIILYGSQARGQAQYDSDVDLLVLLPEEVTSNISDHIQDSLYEISLAEDVVICAIVRNICDWNSPLSQAMPLYHNIQREGIKVA